MRVIQTETFEPTNANETDWLYNGLDVAVTLEIRNALLPQLDATTRATYEFSKAMQGPILEMTARGLLVDQLRRDQLLHQCKRDIDNVQAQLNRILGEGIGIPLTWMSPKRKTHFPSPTELKNIFYDVLGYTPIKKRLADGRTEITVDAEALEKLSANMRALPICNRLLLLRDLDKRRQRLESNLDPDGRERTSFNIGGTNTGRLSSSSSDDGTGGNQQNIDRDLREIYIADPGMKMANFDLEQGDSRNVGARCWHQFLEPYGARFAGAYLDATESSDLHIGVARMVWPHLAWGPEANWPNVASHLFYHKDSYRQISKKLGHATNFDGQPPTLSQRTRVPKNLVKDFQAAYFRAFPCVHERIEWTKRELLRHPVITTLFGRRRIFFGDPKRGETQREAIAYEPQSMTGHEINAGILQLWKARAERDWWTTVWLHLQVHDSILIQYPEELEQEVIPWALKNLRVSLMLAGGREFSVPVEAKTGWNWGEVKKNDKTEVVSNPNGLVKWTGHDPRRKAA